MRTVTIIKILDAIVCDSQADIETAKNITAGEAQALAEALMYGSAHLRVSLSTLVGTPPSTLANLKATIDGTNYCILRTFDTAVVMTAAAEMPLTPINGYAQVSDPRFTKVKLGMGGSAPDGSNKITATVELVIQVPG
jgi:hypothetical protein